MRRTSLCLRNLKTIWAKTLQILWVSLPQEVGPGPVPYLNGKEKTKNVLTCCNDANT